MSAAPDARPPVEDGQVSGDTRPEDCFFFIESEVLEQSQDWSRDEFALYLLHCRGYNPASAGSTYGEKGCRERIGLTRKPWADLTVSLENRGLIRTIEQGRHPVTLLASATHAFDRAFAPTRTDYRKHDGHCWGELVDVAAQLIKIPWRAIDIDRLNPEARIGALTSIHSLRLVVWAYGEAWDDGWVPSNLVWLESQGVVIGRCSQEVRERLGLSPGEVRDAVVELLDCGLLESRELDHKGRGILYLAHPMALPSVREEEIVAA